MNIDNQLLLGLVFITAGIALALLAYAVLLNRRGASEDDLPDEPEIAEGDPAELDMPPEPTRIVAEPKSGIPGFEESTRLVQAPMVEVPEPAAPGVPVADAGQSILAEDSPETVRAQAPDIPAPQAPPVSLMRDLATGRLKIRVGQRTFGSMSELKKTEDWEQVGGLFEELHAWMTVVPPQIPPSPRTPQAGAAEPTKKAPGAMSMVEQINEILSDKLAASSTAPQGVHLAEGADGSIRVFIGVQGYALDQVPNDEVRTLIREAVSEWESRS
jgi:hypothetical protein